MSPFPAIPKHLVTADDKFRLLSQARQSVLILILWLGVFGADLMTGHQIKVTVLYLVPLALALWYVSDFFGLTLIALTSVARFFVSTSDSIFPITASHHTIAAIDAALHGLLLLVFATLLIVLKTYLSLIKKENFNLEHAVALRTDELEKARVAAEAASIAKSAFLANMSHEIRTPLSGVIGMAHLVRRTGLTDKQSEYMTKLEASSQRLLAMLNSVLTLSELEAGKVRVQEMPVQVQAIVGDAMESMRSEADAKGIALSRVVPDLPTALKGDPQLLGDTLQRLTSNAVRFTDTGKISLAVNVLDEQDDSILLKFSVADTGSGMAPDAMARLFQRFEQGDNSSTRRYQGLGLGLAIAKQLALLMGGDVGAESVQGRGSTFWFSARLKKSPSVC